jgi:hypothetical protein
MHRKPEERHEAGSNRRSAIVGRMAGFALGAMIVTGCSDVTAPTGAKESDESNPIVWLQPAPELSALVADLRERVVPAFPEGTGQEALNASLALVTAALDGTSSHIKTVGDVLRAIEGARDAMRRVSMVAGEDAGLQAELDAVGRTLDAVEAALPR